MITDDYNLGLFNYAENPQMEKRTKMSNSTQMASPITITSNIEQISKRENQGTYSFKPVTNEDIKANTCIYVDQYGVVYKLNTDGNLYTQYEDCSLR